MTFSQEQIDRIKELAGIFLPVSDIAVLIGVNPFELKAELKDYDSPARAAYLTGKAEAKADMLAQEMRLAKLGSPLGIESTRAALMKMELDE